MVTRDSNHSTNCAQWPVKYQYNIDENREQGTWKIHKLQLPYTACMSLFQWLLHNPNGQTKEPGGMNLLTKFQPDPTVDETKAAIWKLPFSKETLKNAAAVWDEFLSAQTPYARSERSDWSYTQYEPADKVSARSNGEQIVVGSFWRNFLLFSASLSLSISLSISLSMDGTLLALSKSFWMALSALSLAPWLHSLIHWKNEKQKGLNLISLWAGPPHRKWAQTWHILGCFIR